MSISLEWIIGILVVIFSSLLAIIWRSTINNSDRISRHDVLFATFSGMDKKLDNFHTVLEQHEQREDKQFEDIMHRLERLTINVSLLKKSPVNGGDSV
jgi:hypothetical protein